MRLTIIIKALNEKDHIQNALRSAIDALATIEGEGEVVLADSLSADSTVTLASAFPIRIVQLEDAQDRSCGIGGQLGYQVGKGDFIYLLDGDMELQPGFLPKALAALEADPALAGVAGLVEEKVIANSAFALRAANKDTSTPAKNPIALNMGGLYRRAAIQSIGYFTNRNLHAFEEFELGIRLVAAGWRLERLGVPAIAHFGPTGSSLHLLRRRWKTRYACGHGELFRSALGKPYFGLAISRLRVFSVQLATLLLWLAVVAMSAMLDFGASKTIACAVSSWALVFVAMALRKQSLRHAAYSLAAWHMGIAGFLRGAFTRPAQQPTAPIRFRTIL